METPDFTLAVFDYRYAEFVQTGMGRVTSQLGSELAACGATLLVRPSQDIPCGARVIYTDRGWDALMLARQETAAMRQFRVFVEPTWFCPVNVPIPTALTIHDIIPLEQARLVHTVYFRVAVPYWMRPYTLLTVSRYTANQLATVYPKIPVHVIGNAVDGRFSPPVARALVPQVRTAYHLPDRYLLYVGANLPHKNLEFIDNLSLSVPLPIVAVGNRLSASTFRHGKVLVLPPVSEELMPGLYGGATALLLPSLQEGFGLPAVEAGACGTPVIVSDQGALPETVDGWGQVVPLHIDAWVHAIRALEPLVQATSTQSWADMRDAVAQALRQEGLLV